ncbi:hypothetical protein HF086_008322 [Spodoptera exigua]|uniref:Acyl-CoA oxidase C-terminal domain-containing protein n=1 Tax=Spodoptera exigua TaxID=7107 RepID=A0A922S9E5_SPOEX|nr:hypothetical protein HF086_008322 [Spodoptera exigua]
MAKDQGVDEQLKLYLPDLPKGPLDRYREKATFDWRRMKLAYDNLNTLKLKIAEDPKTFQAESEALFMFDSSLAVKVSLTFRMFSNAIQGNGKSHHYPIIEDVEKAKIGGCFALTEVSHGSNAKGMRTTATYIPEKRQFVMHSADFEAAKCWVGSLGDFVMFNNYHLPKEAALDKLGGVDDNGDYKTPFRDPNKRFGAALGILSANPSPTVLGSHVRYEDILRVAQLSTHQHDYQQLCRFHTSIFLPAAAIGDLRNDNDANCTYEGENSLLLQQASNWLLAVWPRRDRLQPADSPLGSLSFLQDADQLLQEKCSWNTVQEFTEPATFMLKMTAEKVALLKSKGKDNFSAKNESQSYNAVTLSMVYGENYVLNNFYKAAQEFDDANCRAVLLKLVALYGAFLLEKHLATLYIGGYLTGEQGLCLRDGILQLCAQLTPEAVSLVDSLAPPDFCLKSVLGMSDGEAYKHIQSSVMTYPGSMTRPEWWRDVVYWQSYAPSKL